VVFEYDTPSDGERWLIFNRPNSEKPPNQKMQITTFEERPTASGKTMPVLIMKSEVEGNTYVFSAWQREVEHLINDWGKNPKDWAMNWIVFENRGNGVKPYPTQPPQEEIEVKK